MTSASPNSGVYALEFSDGSMYVGASKQMRQRIQTHISWLRRNRGQTKKLQEAYDRFGEPSARVILFCSPDNLSTYEQLVFACVDKPLCRPLPGGIAGKTLSASTRAKMSEAARNKDQTRQSARQLDTWKDPEIRARRIQGMLQKIEERKHAKRG